MSKRFGVEQIFDALREGQADNDIWKQVTVSNPQLGRKKLLDEIIPNFKRMIEDENHLQMDHIVLVDKETHLLADVVEALEKRKLGGPDQVREVVQWVTRLQSQHPHERLMHLKDALEFLGEFDGDYGLQERAKAIWPKHFKEDKDE